MDPRIQIRIHPKMSWIRNTDARDTVVQNMFGKWSEALYVGKAPSARCIWRPGALPDDAHLYYGFSRFAMELNELIGKEAALLPPTDTRWRPDQRALEEGRIAEAENIKLGVEQAQRDRRRLRENGEVSARENTTLVLKDNK
jgi:hypothetical protein